MNALVLSDHFRAAFASDAAFTGRQCANGQSSGEYTLPCLIFEAQVRPLNTSGSAFTFTLNLVVEDSADRPDGAPDPVVAHATAVEAVREKLFGLAGHADSEVITGVPTPRGAAFRAALNAEAILDFRGWSAAESDPAIEAHRFRTPVSITGTALEV